MHGSMSQFLLSQQPESGLYGTRGQAGGRGLVCPLEQTRVPVQYYNAQGSKCQLDGDPFHSIVIKSIEPHIYEPAVINKNCPPVLTTASDPTGTAQTLQRGQKSINKKTLQQTRNTNDCFNSLKQHCYALCHFHCIRTPELLHPMNGKYGSVCKRSL